MEYIFRALILTAIVASAIILILGGLLTYIVNM